nr:hypothetical protein [Actinomycetota bacterium]
MHFCTIIAKNYVAAARVLARSLTEHHPDSTLHVLIVDDFTGYIDPAQEPFEVVTPGDLDIPRFERMAGLYTVLELSTAVKPWLLRHLLDRGEAAIYLDPDIRLYAPIPDILSAVEERGLVLTPHNTRPMPRDGHRPHEQDILMAGAYNLGFIGLRRGEFADFLLGWWGERLESDCVVDPTRGFFVDQRWIDFVPAMADDFELVRDPGFNAAYWNLPGRRLARDNGGYRVDDARLRMFHFSGYDPRRPHVLSTHQDRISLPEHPLLVELCEAYGEELRAAGHEESASWPYGWATTRSGLELVRSVRAAYREASEENSDMSLFDEAGERGFLKWCLSPASPGGRHGVTRYLEVLIGLRPDIRATFHDLDDEGQALGYLDWVRRHGRVEERIPLQLLPADEAGPPSNVPPHLVLGPPPVTVAGYLRAAAGTGEVARQIVRALDTQSVPVRPVALEAAGGGKQEPFACLDELRSPFDINVVCVNADETPSFARKAGRSFFHGRHTIGVWWWELSHIPAWFNPAFAHVQEVWAGSSFISEALAAVSPVPVLH